MTATTLLTGVFLPLSAATVVALVLAVRRPAARLFWVLVDLVTTPPSRDVVGPCDEYERGRVFR